MHPAIPTLVLLGCFLGGRVSVPGEGDPSGIRLVLAATGETIGVTDAEGYYAAELPDSLGEALVEFWRGDRFLASHVLGCDRTRVLPLTEEGYRLETMRVTAPALEVFFEGEAVRSEEVVGDDLRSAAALPSVSEALRQLPGVSAVGRDGFTSAPTIRGLGRDRSIVLLEGVRLSADRGVGPSASFIDPFLLGGLDLVRGTAGTTHGSGAIGGAIAMRLAAPADTFAATARWSAASNGDGRGAALRVSGPVRGWRLALGGFTRRQDEYRFPDGGEWDSADAINSGMENAGGSFVAEREWGGRKLRVTLVGTRARDVGRPTAQSGRRDTIEEEDHAFAAARYDQQRGPWRWESILGFHYPRTLNVGDRFDEDGTTTRSTATENRSVDVAATLRTERGGGHGAWLGGIDAFTRWDVDAAETRTDFAGGQPGPSVRAELVRDARRVDVGAYAGWRRPLRLTGEAQVVARLDVASRGATGQESVSWLAPSFDARLVVPLDARWAVTGGVGRAFRAPRIQELYFEGDRPGGARLANPDLDPETAWSGEAGLRWAGGAWRVRATGWALFADALIVQLPVDAAGDTLRHENVTRGRLLGVEAEADWTAPDERARIGVAYAYTHGEERDGAPLPDVPSGEIRVTGWLRLAGTRADPVLAADAVLRAGAAKTPAGSGSDARWWSEWLGATRIGGDEVGHPGFARWDAGVRWTPGATFDVAARVLNLLDANYVDRPEADAFPEPGRSFTLEVTIAQ